MSWWTVGVPLARSTFDLFAIVKQIVDAKAQFRSGANRPINGPPGSALGMERASIGPRDPLGRIVARAPSPRSGLAQKERPARRPLEFCCAARVLIVARR